MPACRSPSLAPEHKVKGHPWCCTGSQPSCADDQRAGRAKGSQQRGRRAALQAKMQGRGPAEGRTVRVRGLQEKLMERHIMKTLCGFQTFLLQTRTCLLSPFSHRFCSSLIFHSGRALVQREGAEPLGHSASSNAPR